MLVCVCGLEARLQSISHVRARSGKTLFCAACVAKLKEHHLLEVRCYLYTMRCYIYYFYFKLSIEERRRARIFNEVLGHTGFRSPEGIGVGF